MTAGQRISRWKKQILCILGSLLAFAAAVYGENVNSHLSKGYLERGNYGEDSRFYDIVADGAWKEPLSCTVEIAPIQYSEEEALKVMEELYAQIPQMILGENESLNQVTTDLMLVTSFQDLGIKAEWQSKSPEAVDSYGRITAEKISPQGIFAVLSVTLTDGRYKKEGEIKLRVCPPLQSDREKAAEDLQKLIEKADQKDLTARNVFLPQEYNGREIRYQDARTADYRLIPVLGVVLAVLLYGQEKEKEERKRRERYQMLLLDYADVVYQLMVYIGAGLTVRRAWECMVQNYMRRRENGLVQVRPAYEEMALTLSQIQYGESEGKAIDAFGKRCRLQPYRKLSSLLEQNRRTGTKNLTQLLEQEMTAAWEEQKHTAKRLGEEAGTRLLVPLFLMLIVVMVIIMVPALMAVQ